MLLYPAETESGMEPARCAYCSTCRMDRSSPEECGAKQ